MKFKNLSKPQVASSSAAQGRHTGIFGFGRGRSLIIAFALAGLAAVVLYRFPPESYSFYPRCPIYEYLHILCPGCGATRALSALLHGHLVAAMRLNALAVLVLLPLTATYGAMCVKRVLMHESSGWPTIPRSVTIVLVALAVGFTLIRNL